MKPACVIFLQKLSKLHLWSRRVFFEKEATNAESIGKNAFSPVNAANINVEFGAFFRTYQGPEKLVLLGFINPRVVYKRKELNLHVVHLF